MSASKISFCKCPHCKVRVRFRGWKLTPIHHHGFTFGRAGVYDHRWARVSLREADFATCPACHEPVSA